MLIGGSVIIQACLDTNRKDYQGSSLIFLHLASLLLLRAKYNLDAYSPDKLEIHIAVDKGLKRTIGLFFGLSLIEVTKRQRMTYFTLQ